MNPLSPLGLWTISSRLHHAGLQKAALLVKRLSFALYHNSLAPEAEFHSDLRFGHHGFGTVIHSNVTIGRNVYIWHNVTIAVRATRFEPHRIHIEDDVRIGANSVIISPLRGSLTIGRGARIGAGALVVKDVPPGATVRSEPSLVILPEDPPEPATSQRGVLAAEDDLF